MKTKIRAWDKHNKVMLLPEDKEFQNNFQLFPAGNYAYKGEYAEEWLELMWWTGMKDKNSKDIYEGDLVQFAYDNDSHGADVAGTGEVFWMQKYCAFALRREENQGQYDSLNSPTPDKAEELEVVGNIYDN